MPLSSQFSVLSRCSASVKVFRLASLLQQLNYSTEICSSLQKSRALDGQQKKKNKNCRNLKKKQEETKFDLVVIVVAVVALVSFMLGSGFIFQMKWVSSVFGGSSCCSCSCSCCSDGVRLVLEVGVAATLALATPAATTTTMGAVAALALLLY